MCLLIILHLKQLLPNVKLVHVRDSELKMDAGVTAHDVIFFSYLLKKFFNFLVVISIVVVYTCIVYMERFTLIGLSGP